LPSSLIFWLLSQPKNRPHGPTRSLSTGPDGPAGPAGPAPLGLPDTSRLGPMPACSTSDSSPRRAPGSASRHRPGSGPQPCSHLTAPRARAPLAVPARTLQPCSLSARPGTLVVPARTFQPRSPSARPGSPHGPGPDHLNLAHPPCAWALHLQPRPGSGITPTRTCAAPTRPGPTVTMPLPSISGAHSPDSDADPSTNHDSPSRGPPPQGDWQVTGIGVRRQRPLAAHGTAGA
jgi:hypothetical protein